MLFRSEMHNIPIQVTAFSLIYCFDVFQQTSIDITAKQIKRKKLLLSLSYLQAVISTLSSIKQTPVFPN